MLNLSPYLAFNGQARDALHFYQTIFGGELGIMTHGEYQHPDPAVADQVMHGQLEAEGFTLMASDFPDGSAPSAEGNTTICLWGEDFEVGKAWFNALADGGQIKTAFETQVWGDAYGDLKDKYGITWMVNVQAPQQ